MRMCNYYFILLNVNGARASCQFQLVTTSKTTTDGTESDMLHTLFCHDGEKNKQVCNSELCLDENASCAPTWASSCFLPVLFLTWRWDRKFFTSSWKLAVAVRPQPACLQSSAAIIAPRDVEATQPINVGHILSSSWALRTLSFSLLSVSIETILHLISIQSSFVLALCNLVPL